MTALHQIDFGLSGGNYKNAPEGENLYRLLREQGGYVDAWFVTHPHSDHLGAIAYVLEHYGNQISVDQFYFNFPQPNDPWLPKANPPIDIDCTNHFLKLLQEQNRPWTRVDKGFTLDLGMQFGRPKQRSAGCRR